MVQQSQITNFKMDEQQLRRITHALNQIPAALAEMVETMTKAMASFAEALENMTDEQKAAIKKYVEENDIPLETRE